MAQQQAKGRPRLDVDRQQLEFLRSLAFSWKEIANVLGASIKTLQRRAQEWGIPSYTNITDTDLADAVREFKNRFPHAGEAVVKGHLESIGIHVQRERMRQAIWRVCGRQGGPSPPIRRRTYSVPGPNSLWHIDGNHKLIRWRLVIHGGIDGFSRLVTYLTCSNNNRSETVLELFVKATDEYGVPSRVRSDHGGENIQVWQFMEEVRGEGRASYIAGSSTHNTRIERLWRDVYTAVTHRFVNIFHALEENGYVNPLNEADLFCLHYVYIPQINAALSAFKSAWNCHPLSTEGNHSPLQLFAINAIVDPLSDIAPVATDYGLDPDVDPPEPEHLSEVVVPDTRLPLSSASLCTLQSTVDPLTCSGDGIDLYIQAVQCVHQLMADDDIID